MLTVVQRFGKHCICHLQSEHVLTGHFWQPYVGQKVGGSMDVIELIGGAKERAVIK
jgi:hypothetical protein